MGSYYTKSKRKDNIENRGAKRKFKSSILLNSMDGGLSSSNGLVATVKTAARKRGTGTRKRVTQGRIGIIGKKRQREKRHPQPEIKNKEEEQHSPPPPSSQQDGGNEFMQHPELEQVNQTQQVDGVSSLFVEPHFLWRGGRESAVRGGEAKTQDCLLRLIVESQRRIPCKRARRYSTTAPSILKPIPALLEDDLSSKINSVAAFKARNGGTDGSISPYRLQLAGAKRNLDPNKMRTILSLCSGIRGQDRGMAAGR